MKSYSVKELAALVGGEVCGDKDRMITGINTIEAAGPQDVTFIANPKYGAFLPTTRAGAIVVGPDLKHPDQTLIVVEYPYLSFARLVTHIKAAPRTSLGVMPGAYIGEQTALGEEITVYPHTFIGARVTVGDRVTVYPGVFIGDDVRIGDDTVLYPNVTVYNGCILGSRVIVHSGAVIGADGFGFAPDGDAYFKIPQIGVVEIGDDVEIGAGTTIDRATLGKTTIARGTKIDNLIQIAHNVKIGEDTVIAAQTGISGSTKLGRHVVIGGQAGFAGHIVIGDNAMIGGQSGVTNSIPAGTVYMGYPAVPHREWLKISSIIKRLPQMRADLKELKKKVAALEEK